MGDPETESVMLRIKSDIVDLFEGVANNNLNEKPLVMDHRYATCVMMVSGGYPEAYEKGYEIEIPKELPKDVILFHAGTKLINNKVSTNGGRVLAVSAYGNNKDEALSKCYEVANNITFKKKYFRTDIGFDL